MRRLQVTVGNNWAEARGYGSRELLVELTGRAPMFTRRSRAWCTTPHRVSDLVALAEARGFLVTIERDPSAVAPASPEPVPSAGPPESVEGLW